MNAPSLVSGPFTDDFFPFSLTRSVADMRCGILTIREKWNVYLKNKPSLPPDPFQFRPISFQTPGSLGQFSFRIRNYHLHNQPGFYNWRISFD
jgi:hypothetical protein